MNTIASKRRVNCLNYYNFLDFFKEISSPSSSTGISGPTTGAYKYKDAGMSKCGTV